MDDELELEEIKYDDLDDSLKDQVRDHFRSDSYLIPDDWFEHILEAFQSMYEEFQFSENDVEFDIYHNTFKVSGDLNFEHERIKACIPDKLQKYLDDEWVYDISDNFVYSDGINNDYYIDDDLIRNEIENKIFNSDIEVESGIIELDIAQFKSGLIEVIEELKEFGDKINIIKHWVAQMEANELFFKSSITISEDDYDSLIQILYETIHSEINYLVEDELYSAINDIIDTEFKKLWEDMRQAYEFHYTDEYADGALYDNVYEVEVDSNGKQLNIIDLDGM